MVCSECGTSLPAKTQGQTCSRRCRALLRERRKAERRAVEPKRLGPLCSVSECGNPQHAQSLCSKHYQRLLKHGSTDNPRQPMPESRRSALGRWRSMIRRCTDPAAHGYHRYGGRGITVCDEWLSDFDAYYRHIGDPPQPGMSVDRIDNDGPYAPWNVRWATPSQQSRNRDISDYCPRGHLVIGENRYESPDGERSCKECRREANRRSYLRRRAAMDLLAGEVGSEEAGDALF